jgi:hypothetical protein
MFLEKSKCFFPMNLFYIDLILQQTLFKVLPLVGLNVPVELGV